VSKIIFSWNSQDEIIPASVYKPLGGTGERADALLSSLSTGRSAKGAGVLGASSGGAAAKETGMASLAVGPIGGLAGTTQVIPKKREVFFGAGLKDLEVAEVKEQGEADAKPEVRFRRLNRTTKEELQGGARAGLGAVGVVVGGGGGGGGAGGVGGRGGGRAVLGGLDTLRLSVENRTTAAGTAPGAATRPAVSASGVGLLRVAVGGRAAAAPAPAGSPSVTLRTTPAVASATPDALTGIKISVGSGSQRHVFKGEGAGGGQVRAKCSPC
jgi:hypothetical protein